MTTYYADLNPRFGAKYERRWAVFMRKAPGVTSQTHLHYASRKAAENAAAKITEQEREPLDERFCKT